MHDVKQLQRLVEEHLRRIEFPEKPSSLYEPLRYMLDIGGKRLRPVLALMACELFSDDIYKALYPALAIEVFHNFTLLHDDIMDKAPMRRAKTTVHERWNPNVAILSGDAMFVKSVQLMMNTEDRFVRPLLDLFNKTALEVCEGQQIDMDFEMRDDVTLEEYLEMIRCKTAVLLGCSLKTGALLGGAGEEDCALMYAAGCDLGIAFQIQDDLLDLYGSEQDFGKQQGGDVISGKKTFLLLKALEVAEDKDQLRQLLSKASGGREKIKDYKKTFDMLEIPAITETAIDYYFERAMHSIITVKADDERKRPLIELAGIMRKRVS